MDEVVCIHEYGYLEVAKLKLKGSNLVSVKLYVLHFSSWKSVCIVVSTCLVLFSHKISCVRYKLVEKQPMVLPESGKTITKLSTNRVVCTCWRQRTCPHRLTLNSGCRSFWSSVHRALSLGLSGCMFLWALVGAVFWVGDRLLGHPDLWHPTLDSLVQCRRCWEILYY